MNWAKGNDENDTDDPTEEMEPWPDIPNPWKPPQKDNR